MNAGRSATTGSGVRGVTPGCYRVDPAGSRVAFRVRKLGLFTIRGTFTPAAGTVEVGDGRARARIELDAASFTTPVRRRDLDIRGPRFLDAERFPTLCWTGELADGTANAPGTLRVRDTAAEVGVEVDQVEIGDGGAVHIRAHTRIDRCAVGVAAGRGVIGRLLEVDLEVTLLPVRPQE